MKRKFGASEGASIYLLGITAGYLLSIFAALAFSKASATLGGLGIKEWLSYIVMQAGFFAVVIAYSKVRSVPSFAFIKKPRNNRQLWFMPLIAIATVLIFLPLANLWVSFLNLIGFNVGGYAVKIPAGSVGIYFLVVCVLAILPAFGEELIMRGMVFRGLASRSVWFGVLTSALFFSLMHANPLQTVHQFGLGIVLALVFILTGSLLSSILVHFFNNFISITLATYLPEVDAIYVKLGYFNWLVGAISVIVGLVLLLVLLFAIYRLSGRDDYDVVHGGIEYDGFTLYPAPSARCKRFIPAFFAFFKSLFSKSGLKTVTQLLARESEVEYLGKAQPMLGVWLALGLVVALWIYTFIAGLL